MVFSYISAAMSDFHNSGGPTNDSQLNGAEYKVLSEGWGEPDMIVSGANMCRGCAGANWNPSYTRIHTQYMHALP